MPGAVFYDGPIHTHERTRTERIQIEPLELTASNGPVDRYTRESGPLAAPNGPVDRYACESGPLAAPNGPVDILYAQEIWQAICKSIVSRSC